MAENTELRDKLLYKRENGYKNLTQKDKKEMIAFSEGYKAFIQNNKTERECIKSAIDMAKANGFTQYKWGKPLRAGDKVYVSNRGKAAVFAIIGADRLADGANIAVSHVDSPRIDIKQNPIYEDSELCYLKTHYYGGIKKYQWFSIPLELRGVISLKNGKTIEIKEIGSPVFVINDLLPHLGQDQMKKTLSDAFSGESLNVLVGSEPLANDDGKDVVLLNVLHILNQKYGIIEEDFLSAELSLVPAFNALDVGFDKSLIGAYGHDDRVCAYPSLISLFDTGIPKKTAICILSDKEEIGSEGVSGMKSAFFDSFLSDIANTLEQDMHSIQNKSICLSADVNVGFDPNYADVCDRKNTAFLNYGVVLCKYTGSRGKSGASDASSELVAKIRNLLSNHKIIWQMGALGKVDTGGGGTVAMFMAQRNIETIDLGVPVLGMHSPYEVVAKLDVYMAYKSFLAFYKN